jgi:hypothetical protein
MMSPSAVISNKPRIVPTPCAIGAAWPANCCCHSPDRASRSAYSCRHARTVTAITFHVIISCHCRHGRHPSIPDDPAPDVEATPTRTGRITAGQTFREDAVEPRPAAPRTVGTRRP